MSDKFVVNMLIDKLYKICTMYIQFIWIVQVRKSAFERQDRRAFSINTNNNLRINFLSIFSQFFNQLKKIIKTFLLLFRKRRNETFRFLQASNFILFCRSVDSILFIKL